MPVPEHERDPSLYASRDGGQSLRRRRGQSDPGTPPNRSPRSVYSCIDPDPARISDTHKLSYSLHVDYSHSEYSNVSPLKLPLVSRDWQQHHQGRN
jgi:hypothetical protein